MGEEAYAEMVLALTKHYQKKYFIPHEQALALAIGFHAYNQRSTA